MVQSLHFKITYSECLYLGAVVRCLKRFILVVLYFIYFILLFLSFSSADHDNFALQVCLSFVVCFFFIYVFFFFRSFLWCDHAVTTMVRALSFVKLYIVANQMEFSLCLFIFIYFALSPSFVSFQFCLCADVFVLPQLFHLTHHHFGVMLISAPLLRIVFSVFFYWKKKTSNLTTIWIICNRRHIVLIYNFIWYSWH